MHKSIFANCMSVKTHLINLNIFKGLVNIDDFQIEKSFLQVFSRDIE